MNKKLNIGLIGFGVVGEGVYQVILNTPSLQARIKKIAIKHPEKERNAPLSLFTSEVNDILQDEEINVVIELIDDAEAAYTIVKTALQNKKHVVSANKRMISHHLPELIALQRKNNVSLLYEAAVCGSIPIIRNLEEYFDNDLLNAISGIVNGSTNFILTQIKEQGLTYETALKQAQESGFAESNPALDVEGKDAVNKLNILLKHTFGINALPSDILHKGITQISAADSTYAGEKGYDIKLVANAFRISDKEVVSYVLPQFIHASHQLKQVRNEYNGVLLSSALADEQFLYGKGAGRYPTASAVLSDISALRYGYRYEYRKSTSEKMYTLSNEHDLTVYVSYKDPSAVVLSDFSQIDETYIGSGSGYLIGKISIQHLINANWIHDTSVSVIELRTNKKDAPTRRTQHEALVADLN